MARPQVRASARRPGCGSRWGHQKRLAAITGCGPFEREAGGIDVVRSLLPEVAGELLPRGTRNPWRSTRARGVWRPPLHAPSRSAGLRRRSRHRRRARSRAASNAAPRTCPVRVPGRHIHLLNSPLSPVTRAHGDACANSLAGYLDHVTRSAGDGGEDVECFAACRLVDRERREHDE
jgi:hypothetical protein